MVWDDIIKECIDNDDCLLTMDDIHNVMARLLEPLK
jgi:hypothetical protein